MRWRSALAGAACAAVTVVALRSVLESAVRPDAIRVVAVHAGGGWVPSNLLRVYVELSGPMEPGTALENIRLVDDRGREVKGALLHLPEELWSPDGRWLTLLFDPGRVKRGLRPHLEWGAPLLAGRRYRLVIDSAWRDAAGRPLAAPFEQELRVGAFDSVPPNPARWALSSPRPGSRDELRVDFGEPLDHALAPRMISVVDATGARVAGSAALTDGDRVWRFVPRRGWPARATVRVDAELEDLAGNNLVRPFDSDRASGGRSAEAVVSDTAPRLIAVRMRP